MEGTNILSSGIETLNSIKEQILELNGCKEKNEQLIVEEKRLEKVIEAKEKEIQEEMTNTLKKRKEEIEASFDEQIDKSKTKIKKIQAKKDKLKDAKVSERIHSETAQFEDENKSLKSEAKKLFKQNHVPKIYNSSLYYALFFPKGILDVFVILFFILLAFLAIPCGIYYWLLPERKMLYLVVIYFITIIVICGLYLLINNVSKSRHREVIIQVKQLRYHMKINRKKIKAIKNSILKDKDESTYGLDKFNKEVQELELSVTDSESQKQEAITNFENVTKVVITSEIKSRYEEELNQLKSQYENTHTESNEYDIKIKEMSLEMANNYEAYIGKEYLTIQKLDSLISIMESKNIATISEAIVILGQEN